MKKHIALFFLLSAVFSTAAADTQKDKIKSAELQWILCEKTPNQFFRKIGDPDIDESEEFKTQWLDDQDLNIYNNGTVIRIRLFEDSATTAVKKNFTKASEIDSNLYKDLDPDCEKDSYPEFSKYGCTLKNNQLGSRVVFSAEQQKFFRRLSLRVDQLKTYGPIQTLSWSWEDGSGQKWTLQKHSLNTSTQFMELSTRVDIESEMHEQTKYTQQLSRQRVEMCAQQKSITGDILNLLKNQIPSHSFK